jgi:hypothetical protein
MLQEKQGNPGNQFRADGPLLLKNSIPARHRQFTGLVVP